MNGIRIILFVLVITHILPVAVTQLLILEYPFEKRENGRIVKWAGTAANVLLNVLAFYEVVTYSKFKLTEILDFTCSYQDISRLAASNIVSLALSVLIGVGIYIGVRRYYKDEPLLHVPHIPSKCVLLMLFAAIPIILGYYYGGSGASHLAIHEICRRTTIVDAAEYSWEEDAAEDGVSYVVIINNGILTCEPDLMYLSDNMDELQERQAFRRTAMKPGETYRFYMSSEDSLDIKRSGGSVVCLSDQFGNILDSIEVPALTQNESYKNMETGWRIVDLTEEAVEVAAPSFSRESGFYDGAFELELTADPGAAIYYTLDSSSPTVGSMEYTQPIYVYDRSKEENRYRSIKNITNDYLYYDEYDEWYFGGKTPVDKCFVVRAVAVDGDGKFSDIVTKSYFINQNQYRDGTVISLVSDPEGLFGDEYGIYVTGKAYDEWYSDAYAKMDVKGTIDTPSTLTQNYFQRGIEWERESNLEVFQNADLLLSQPVGIRIQGHAFRGSPNKRFSIYARKEYGSSEYFDVNLINGYSQHSLLLRLGQGGDLHVISQMIGKDRDVATTDLITVDVFLDGEFWYTTYLCEKFDEKNFSKKYNLFKDNIVIYKAWDEEDEDSAQAGENPRSGLTDFIRKNDLSDNENYLKYNEMLDIQSYIDWYCINIFMQNMDYSEYSNTLYWHTVVRENDQEGDSRWRLSLYDMDIGWSKLERIYGDLPYYETNPFKTNGITEWSIYSALKKNECFRKQFVLTFMDLINTNFSAENTAAIMERLGIVNKTYQEFFENRADYIVPYMAEEFELTGTQEEVTLSSNLSGTPVTLNTISPELQPPNGASEDTAPPETFLWTGSYFTDYPVTAAANAPDFSHWEVTANGSVQKFTDKTIEVPVSAGGVQIHAVFQ